MAIPETKFKKGDLVRLISGGPKMVVQNVSGDIVGCEWVGQVGKKSEVFAHLLEKVQSGLSPKDPEYENK